MTGEGLVVDGLVVEFATDRGRVRAVDGVSFAVAPGETLGLVGESGCGKTVTGLALLGLVPSSGRVASGRVVLDGRDLTALAERELADVRGRQVAMVFQEPMTSLDPAFTVGDQIAEVVRRHEGLSRKAARERAVEMLDLVGIPSAAARADDYPHAFSGGMRQRAMIAMALVCRPRVLVADEPTTALDVTTQAQIVELLRRLRDELGMATLFITHDLGVVADLCDRVTVMYAGQVVEAAPVDDLFYEPAHPYTEGLLGCLPQEHERERLVPIPGVVPPLHALPWGCRYHPRCPYALPGVCTDQPPALLAATAAHAARCARVEELALRGVAEVRA